ncbi:MAG: hypothetical protein WC613_01015 [Candidatus Aenigmatarchaeota archaeon]
MKYDGVLIALYILVLVVIVVKIFDMVAITVVLILIILMVIIQKSGLEKLLKFNENERNKKLDEILAKVDDISKRTDNFKDDINRQVVFVDNKVSEVRHFVEVEVSDIYNDLSRKLTGIEDRIGELRQTLASSIGSMDERIRGIESKKDVESVEF